MNKILLTLSSICIRGSVCLPDPTAVAILNVKDCINCFHKLLFGAKITLALMIALRISSHCNSIIELSHSSQTIRYLKKISNKVAKINIV